MQALRAEQFLLNLCYEDYGEIQLTPHMCNLVVDVWCRVENMRRAELLVKKMDEQVISHIGLSPPPWLKRDNTPPAKKRKKRPCVSQFLNDISEFASENDGTGSTICDPSFF